MIRQNPQMNSAWDMAQQLSTGNKQQVINEIARQKGININEIQQLAQSFGINI